MEERIRALEQEVVSIKERNRRVESDKAWERSKFRILLIAAAIYVFAVATLYALAFYNASVYVSAIIPAVGYLFSTWSLPSVKRWWIRKYTSL